MSEIKLQNINGEMIFQIPLSALEHAEFNESSDYEVIAKKGMIVLVKKKPHHSTWIFDNSSLTDEDEFWLESSEF